MYYKGIPLNESSLISKAEICRKMPFFVKKDDSPTGISAFERFFDQKLDLVVYQNIQWNNKELMEHHKYTYNNIPYYTENTISKNVYQITCVSDFKISGTTIFQYDTLWRPIIEQSLDENYLLVEYRKLFYEGEKMAAIKEKIFFPSWHISEEKYGN